MYKNSHFRTSHTCRVRSCAAENGCGYLGFGIKSENLLARCKCANFRTFAPRTRATCDQVRPKMVADTKVLGLRAKICLQGANVRNFAHSHLASKFSPIIAKPKYPQPFLMHPIAHRTCARCECAKFRTFAPCKQIFA